MKRSTIQHALMTVTLLLCVGVANASVKPAPEAAEASAPGPFLLKAGKSPKNTAKIKQVNINNASKAELQTLPGITAELADKIIAGRPYNSKAVLVNRKIVPDLVYENIKMRIVAGQK